MNASVAPDRVELAVFDFSDAFCPPTSWSQPYAYCGFGGALAGFPHEVWMHTMGLIMSGAFDRFPRRRLVIGHMGESMPLQL